MVDNVHIQMCIWSPSYQRLLNLKSYEGVDSPLEAWGFDAKGKPVFKRDRPELKYKIVGETPTTRVDLSATATLGVRPDMKREPNRYLPNGEKIVGKLIVPPKVFGFGAMSIMLGRAGCQAPKDLEAQITALVNNGMTRIWLYRESNARGMAQAYGFSDFWNVSAEPPLANYDGFNDFLKKLKSDFRIITKTQINVLRRGELTKLLGPSDI